MMKNVFIKNIQANTLVQDLFLIVSANLAQAKNGPYWQLTLQDKTGQIEARIWSPASQNYSNLTPGQIVLIKATAQSYNQQVQLNIDSLQPISPEQIDLLEFVPSTSTPPEQLYQEIINLIDQEISFSVWQKIFKSVYTNPEIKEKLLSALGAKKIHHAYVGGLLEHTLAVCRICLSLSKLYPQVDKEILLLAASVHDLGKIYEISMDFGHEYTDPGKLLGHIFLGLEKLQPFLQPYEQDPKTKDLILHLKHIILSHHGELDFGSPKQPQTIEAMLLHFADNIDAKVNSMQASIDNVSNPNNNWTEYNRALQRYVYVPNQTPTTNSRHQPKEKLCSLPLKE